MSTLDTAAFDGGNVEPRELTDEMRSSYLDYAMSVIVGRALPDVRDGLKPVHRRVLFAMSDLGLQPNRPYVKCAKVVGETMGSYHPHGDSAIYDTLVRLAQDFSSRYPLVDGQGNFGNIDGYQAAAMRYTECRMTPLATQMLRELHPRLVDYGPNYDASRQLPLVCRRASPTCSSTARPGSRSGWPPTSLLTTWARRSTRSSPRSTTRTSPSRA
jgi:DNA gyrase subunit A